jgi:hypothetical protein
MKVTVVSTLPWALFEPKYGLIPDLYMVPRAKKRGEIGILTVADGYHYQLIPMASDRMPPLKVVDVGEVIAESIITDYISASLAIDRTPLENGAVPIPGLFWVEGVYEDHKSQERDAQLKQKLKLENAERIHQALQNTTAWFERLIKVADDDWAKYHQYRFITDSQRAACGWLGLQREWNFSVFEANNSLCWACKKVVNPTAIICSCGAILNQAEYEKRKSQFVKA